MPITVSTARPHQWASPQSWRKNSRARAVPTTSSNNRLPMPNSANNWRKRLWACSAAPGNVPGGRIPARAKVCQEYVENHKEIYVSKLISMGYKVVE